MNGSVHNSDEGKVEIRAELFGEASLNLHCLSEISGSHSSKYE